jgi:predicted ATP-grasp superfamily ATP-dependent carboligase
MHGSRDVLAAALEMSAGKLSLADYLRCWRKPLVFAAFAKDDLMPGIVDLPLAVARVLRRYLPIPARPAHRPDGSRLRESH